MFKNYLVSALRNLNKHKGYSLINIVGLAIGMTCCILIMLWVADELSFDRFHENSDRIYRLGLDANLGAPLVAPVSNGPSAPAMIEEYPEVINAVRIDRPGRVAVKYGEREFFEENVTYADNSIFDIFTFPFTKGDPSSALLTAYSVVITEDMAEKYFGGEDPIGKTLQFDGNADFTITGVIKNLPHNSHLQFDMIRSFETLYQEQRGAIEQWMGFRFFTYLLLADNIDFTELENKFPALVTANLGPMLDAYGGTIKFFLQPLTRIHLYTKMEHDISANGDIAYVYLFSGIALFVLLIACVNFINLATARSASRAVEVGIRKTFGADRKGLIRQFLGESIVFSLLAMAVSSILLELVLPIFKSLTDRELSLNYLETPWLIAVYVGFALFVGLIAGSYPAFFLSSFQPIQVLRGNLKKGASCSRLRHVLVISQFAISIVLIVGTITIYNQLGYMKNKKLGFEKEQLVVIPGQHNSSIRSLDTIRDELSGVPGVINVAASSMVPGRGVMKGVLRPEGFSEDQPQTMDILSIDHNFIPTFGMEVVSGRNFSAEIASDTSDVVMINEAAARKFGWDDPIGKTFIFSTPSGNGQETTTLSVIGVVKDFHISSLRQDIEPVYIDNTPSQMNGRKSSPTVPSTTFSWMNYLTAYTGPRRDLRISLSTSAFLRYSSAVSVCSGCPPSQRKDERRRSESERRWGLR
jgi:putative ABC transport system permease protein